MCRVAVPIALATAVVGAAPGVSTAHATTSQGRAYVVNTDGDSVSVIDTATRTVIRTIMVGAEPEGAAISPDGRYLYVADAGTTTVTVVDTRIDRLVATIAVGEYPSAVAIAPNGSRVYVANTGPDTGPGGSTSVSVIDARTWRVADTIDVGEAPQALAVSPDGGTLYVTTHDGLAVVDLTDDRTIGTISLPAPHGVAVSSEGTRAYVADARADDVSVVNTTTGTMLGEIALSGRLPWRLALSADGSRLYVADTNSDQVSVVDTASGRELATVGVGHDPTGIAVSPEGSVWTTDHMSGTVSVIDPVANTLVSTIRLGLAMEPNDIVFGPATVASESRSAR
jgi:phospholipase C